MMNARELEALRVAYNEEHPKNRIKKGNDIWNTITSRLREECKSAAPECIVHNLLHKPDAPMSWKVNLNEWLSSDDIDAVQRGYTKLLPDYYYVGTIPIDFNKKSKVGKCLVSSLCSLKLKDLKKKGYGRVGIVFNTDVSTGPGEHWIAVFCDFRPELEYPQMTYFDSYSQEPEPEIQELMDRWSHELSGMKLQYNAIRHQYKNAQCGMYSTYFLHCCLFNIPMEKKIPDDVMAMIRAMFFNIA